VVAGPGADIGRDASALGERGGIFDFAVRRRADFAADFADLLLRADLRAVPRRALTVLRLRAGAARLALPPLIFTRLALLAFRLFAILASR
jgi:hypothetical protein